MAGTISTKRKLSGCRILVVEDDYFIANDIRDFLKDLGCEILGPFSTIEDSMREIGDDVPDAAILDVNLSGRAVYPLAKMLMQRKIPVLFVTGYDPSTIHGPFKSMPHLAKPINARRLQDAVTRMLFKSAVRGGGSSLPPNHDVSAFNSKSS